MFARKKDKKPVPRALNAIQQDYQQICLQIGQSEYQRYVHEKDLEKLNKRAMELNQEAAERQRLDAEAAAKAAPKSEEQKQSEVKK